MKDIIKLVIISETPLVANLLTSYLAEEPELEVLRTAQSVREVTSGPQDFDMLLINSDLPEQGAMKLARHYSSQDKVPGLLAFNLTDSRSNILNHIEAGFDGYLLKEQALEDLVKMILLIDRDRATISPRIASAVMNRLKTLADLLAQYQTLVDHTDSLTSREEEVLNLMSLGKTNQEIADELVIALGTAKNHVHSIFQKLNVKNRREAALYWLLIQQKNTSKGKNLDRLISI